jgi:hypothetical protein
VWGFRWGEREERKQFGKCKRNWEDNIKIGIKEIGWRGEVDWFGLAQDRYKWWAVVITGMNLRDPLNAGKLSSS